MTRTLMVTVVLGLAACVVQTPTNQPDPQTSLPGTYLAQVNGEQAVLVLAADGTGTLNGQPGQWTVQFGQLMLSDGDQWVPAEVSGDSIIIHAPDGDVVFTRSSGDLSAAPGSGPATASAGGGAAAAGAPDATTPARAFVPGTVVPGDTVDVASVSARFTRPRGWTGKDQTMGDGTPSFLMSPPDSQTRGIFVARRLLSSKEASAPMTTLLAMGVQQILGTMQVETMVPAEALDIGGQPGGRIAVQASPPGSVRLEIYLGAVVTDGYAFVVVGTYEADQADNLRPFVETVLASLVGREPPRNSELESRLVGCWEDYSRSSSSNGSGSFSSTVRLAADGSYLKRTFISAGSGDISASSDDKEAGQWRVEGETLIAIHDGEVSLHPVSFQGGILFLGGAKHLPCH